MMTISTRGRYGTRLMLELASHYGEGPIVLKEIARKQEVSDGYLEQIIPLLRTSGLISSTRGARGGYTLAREPDRINLLEVIMALEGSIDPVDCVSEPSICNRSEKCVTRDIWIELKGKIVKTLESVSLKDLVKMRSEETQSSTGRVVEE